MQPCRSSDENHRNEFFFSVTKLNLSHFSIGQNKMKLKKNKYSLSLSSSERVCVSTKKFKHISEPTVSFIWVCWCFHHILNQCLIVRAHRSHEGNSFLSCEFVLNKLAKCANFIRLTTSMLSFVCTFLACMFWIFVEIWFLSFIFLCAISSTVSC